MSRQLVDLLAEGLQLWVDKGELCFRAAKGKMTPALREQLVSAKVRLLEELEDGRKYASPSFDQQRLWYLDQWEPGSVVYNMPSAYRLRGRLDVPALERSLNRVVERHETLRTSFGSIDGESIQIISHSMQLELHLVDLTDFSGADQETRLEELLAEQARRSFDLSSGPLVRTSLVKMGDDDHVLTLMTHHIVFDGWSEGVLLDELGSIYKRESSGDGPPLVNAGFQYSDFVSWQRDAFQGAVSEKQTSYWREQLDGELPVLELPTDMPRPPVQAYEGATETRWIPEDLIAGLQELARREGATLFMTLLAAFNVLLHRYTGQRDILVGTPVANRNQLEFENLIGFLTNTLVLRTGIDPTLSFSELLGRVRETCLGAYGHQDMPFGRLVEELQPTRDLSRTPLFQAVFGFNEARHHSRSLGDAVEVEPLELESGVARTDLVLWTRQDDRGVRFVLEYDTNLFHEETARHLLEHYEILLGGTVSNPEQSLHAVPLLSEKERELLLVQWNATDSEYSEGACFHQLFERHVEESPDSTAVALEDRQLSYRELNRRSNQLAHFLRRQNVQRGVLVGILMDRTPEMLVGLLGIHKAGGAYVPLDPDFPSERLNFMVNDAGVPVLLTQKALLETQLEHQAKVVVIDEEWEAIAEESEENPAVGVASADLAYVIYTSGSTGEPKGVEVLHGALTNFLESMSREPGLNAEDRLLAVTTLSFDIAALELFLPLSVGASVILVSREVSADGERLLETLETSGITVMQATPATWRLLLEVGWNGSDRLRVLCGGEALPPGLAEELLKRSSSLWNMYGPTETTIWSACKRMESGEGPVLIGRPIANTQIYILDDHLQPVPVGVPGELYIGGAGLARGYLKRDELTAEKFVASPFIGEARIYRTGDLARYRPSGEIECLGRLDHQVKLRGFRIELGEIEAVLCQHPTVEQAVVDLRGAGEESRLVAYVVLVQPAKPSAGELQRHLREKLPEYMVPATYVTLDAIPLTPNGKVDRKALPEPEAHRSDLGEQYVAPGTPTEVALAEQWSEVLKVDRVGIHDNFFDLGGHSLLAVRLLSRVRSRFQVDLSLPSLFLHPTIADLASEIDTLEQDSSFAESALAVEEDRI